MVKIGVTGMLLAGDIIDFDYTDPTGGNDVLAIQGTDGWDAASFTHSVIVSIGRPGPSAPGAPTLDAGSDSGVLGDRITNDTTPTVSGTAGANNTVKLYDTDGTTLLGTATANGSGAWSITSSTLSQGSHTLKVLQVDGSSSASPLSTGLSVTIDTSAPSAPSAPDMALGSDTGVNTDDITSNTTPTFTGTAEAGSTVVLYDTDGSTVLGSAVATGGNWTITSSTLSQGAHTLTAKATDVAGNVSVAGSGLQVIVDTTAPTLAITSSASTLNAGQTATISFTFSEAPSGFTAGDVTMSGGTLSGFSGSGLVYTGTFTPTANVNAGTASISVASGSYTDLAGNGGGAGASPSLTFDTLVPTIPSTPDLAAGSDDGASDTDNVTTVATPTFTGTAEAGSTVRLYDTDGTTVLGTGVATGGTWSITTSTLSTGYHTISAKAFDAAGNASIASPSLMVTINASVIVPETPAPAPTLIVQTTPFGLITTGDAAPNVILSGGWGADTVLGGGGDDVIYGGSRGDLLQGNQGADSITGGGGSDTIAGGQDRDFLHGNAGDDVIYGDRDNDSIAGGQGDDYLHGNAGDDLLLGDLGDDVLLGGQGNDVIQGGAGRDILSGDLGDDVLTGGAGMDLFFFADGAGRDVITDFNRAEGDVIVLSISQAADFQALASKMAMVGADTVISLGAQTIVLVGVAMSSLTAQDFAIG